MQLNSIRQLKNLAGKRVLLRVDFNVPLSKDLVVDHHEDFRIAQTLPTIKYLLKKKAKVIIVAHLGRPNGKVVEGLRLDPVAKRLAQLLGREIYKIDVITGSAVVEQTFQLKDRDILMLENVRFDAREEKSSVAFAKELASLADIYVNDAFGVSHRNQASVSTIQKYLPSYAGLLLEREITNLYRTREKPKQPLVVIIGGAKISTKIKLIKSFLPTAKQILLGGALANTVLRVHGVGVGKSLVEPGMFRHVKSIKLTDDQLRLPLDGVMARSYTATTGRLDALGDIKKNEVILDIGPDTLHLYEKIIGHAKMVIWNGPMGLIETPAFAHGTEKLIRILARSRAEVIVGGGETVGMIRKMKMEKKFSFISTGGGAMLEFLEGKDLPGLKRLIKNSL
jgi:phosphoglycerate kinase